MNTALLAVKLKWFLIYGVIFGAVVGIPGLFVIGGVYGTGVAPIDSTGESMLEATGAEQSPEDVGEEFFTALIIDDIDTAESLLHGDSDTTRDDLYYASERSPYSGNLNVVNSERIGENDGTVHVRVKIDKVWRSAQLERTEDGDWRIVEADL